MFSTFTYLKKTFKSSFFMRSVLTLTAAFSFGLTPLLWSHGGGSGHSQEKSTQKADSPRQETSPTVKIPSSLKEALDIITLSLNKIEIADRAGSSILTSYAYRDDIKVSFKYFQEHLRSKDEKADKRLVSALDRLLEQLEKIHSRVDGWMRLDSVEFEKLKTGVKELTPLLTSYVKG